MQFKLRSSNISFLKNTFRDNYNEHPFSLAATPHHLIKIEEVEHLTSEPEDQGEEEEEVD